MPEITWDLVDLAGILVLMKASQAGRHSSGWAYWPPSWDRDENIAHRQGDHGSVLPGGGFSLRATIPPLLEQCRYGYFLGRDSGGTPPLAR
jgi:hypothetical protein